MSVTVSFDGGSRLGFGCFGFMKNRAWPEWGAYSGLNLTETPKTMQVWSVGDIRSGEGKATIQQYIANLPRISKVAEFVEDEKAPFFNFDLEKMYGNYHGPQALHLFQMVRSAHCYPGMGIAFDWMVNDLGLDQDYAFFLSLYFSAPRNNMGTATDLLKQGTIYPANSDNTPISAFSCSPISLAHWGWVEAYKEVPGSARHIGRGRLFSPEEGIYSGVSFNSSYVALDREVDGVLDWCLRNGGNRNVGYTLSAYLHDREESGVETPIKEMYLRTILARLMLAQKSSRGVNLPVTKKVVHELVNEAEEIASAQGWK